MSAIKAIAGKSHLGPWSAGWPEPVTITLGPAALEAQPSAYIQAVWKDRKYGTAASVGVSAAVAGNEVLVRLEWQAVSPRFGITDNNVFPDGCGVLLPANGEDAELSTMGSPDAPVVSWYWRAGTDVPFVGDAQGLGTVSRRKSHVLKAAAEWANGRWAVVFRSPAGEHGLPANGAALRAAFGVWTGANEERAGLAAYSQDWSEIAMPASRGGR